MPIDYWDNFISAKGSTSDPAILLLQCCWCNGASQQTCYSSYHPRRSSCSNSLSSQNPLRGEYPLAHALILAQMHHDPCGLCPEHSTSPYTLCPSLLWSSQRIKMAAGATISQYASGRSLEVTELYKPFSGRWERVENPLRRCCAVPMA